MDEVRRLRLEKGWSQNELAYHAKLAPSVISLIETGKREPNATTLRKLAEALGVRIPDLFEESGLGKAQRRSSLEPSLFNGLEGEWRCKLEESERAIRYITGRAEWYEQELERGRGHEYKTADRAYILAVQAVEEFSSFNRWFFDVVAWGLGREIENGNASELVDEFYSLEETFIERISHTQRLLLDYANGLAETEDQRDALARRRKTADANVNRERHRSA